MSYARFSEGDIYLFAHVCGGICCCSCELCDVDPSFDTYEDAIKHVKDHIAAGHSVPNRCLEGLLEDQAAGISLEPEEGLL